MAPGTIEEAANLESTSSPIPATSPNKTADQRRADFARSSKGDDTDMLTGPPEESPKAFAEPEEAEDV